MPLISQNFDEVPDSIPVIGSGIYDAEITKVEIVENKALKAAKERNLPLDDKCGKNLEITWKILNDGPFKDLQATQWIAYFDANGAVKANQFAKVALKRVTLSTKVDTSQGLNTDDLLGKVGKLVIEEGVYTPPGGTPRKNSSIKNVLVPGDDGYGS